MKNATTVFLPPAQPPRVFPKDRAARIRALQDELTPMQKLDIPAAVLAKTILPLGKCGCKNPQRRNDDAQRP